MKLCRYFQNITYYRFLSLIMIVSYSTSNATMSNSKLKTLVEHRLRCINWLSLFLIVALFMGLIIVLRERVPGQDVCLTDACIESASNVLKYMDSSVDPCVNFYKFACGNYIKHTVIPDDKPYESHFTALIEKVYEQLQLIFEERFVHKSKPYKLLKTVYDLCMDTNAIEESGLDRAKELLRSLGGWPILDGLKWNRANFTWTDLVYKLRRRGFKYNYFFIISVEPDDKNTTRRVLTLDQNVPKLKDFLYYSHKDNVSAELYNYMFDIAKVFGANSSVADKDIKDIIQLEIKLTKIRVSSQERKNSSILYNDMTIKELQHRFPAINWLEYIINMANSPKFNFTYKDTIVVRVPTYFTALEKLLKNTTERVQANYILTRAITWLTPFLTQELRRIQWRYRKFFTSVINEEARWKECIKVAQRNTGLPLYSLYIQKHFNRLLKDNAELLVRDIKNEVKLTIEQLEWLDNSTKKNAFEKLDSLLVQIGYPDELLVDKYLDDFYSNLTITTRSYVDAMLQTNLFHQNKKFLDLLKTVNRGDWTEYAPPTMVNAFYVRTENSIKIPAAILHDIFFDANRSRYMNYASLGNIIGHELIHGFDDRGSQYDKNGNMNDWWSKNSRKEFQEKVKCVINQYNRYNFSQYNISINGVLTQNENVADNGGIKLAYLAYQRWVKRNRPEQKLPGLHYTPQQMFWISSAQLWCYKARIEDIKGRTKIDSHSIPEFRVIGSLSNFINFSNDFHCPLGSPMNPENKCVIW